MVAPRPLVDRLAILRQIADLQGDLIGEVAVADLLDGGEVARHVRRIRRICRERRDLLANVLRKELGGVLSFEVPTGGTAIWARVAEDVDPERWAALAIEEGASLRTARVYTVDGGVRPFVRLGFSALDDSELVEAVRRLARARARLAAAPRWRAAVAAAR